MLLVGAHVGLLGVHDLAGRPWATLGLLTVAFAALAWSVFGIARVHFSAAWVLGVAVVLRVLLLPLPATLSDDVLRYLWDGEVVAAGFNPYAVAPEADELAGLRDADWEVMPHRDVETVYPPLALGLFSIAAALPQPLLSWKLLLVAAELLGCAILLRVAVLLGVGARRVALYAWNPLVTLEVAGMGHVDALGVTLVVATVWALIVGRRWAPLAAAGGVLVKLVPILVVPLWARRAPRPALFLTVCALTVVAGLAPVFALTGGVPPGWVRLGVSWEFNGPLYEPLWRTLEALRLDLGVKSIFDGMKSLTGAHEFWNLFYPWVYPRLLAKGLLAGLLGWLLWRIWRLPEPGPAGESPARAAEVTGRTFAALVLCSATVYPWYLLWMLPWAALTLQRAWLSLSVLVVLSYLPQVSALPMMPWVFAAIWVPFFLLLWHDRSWSIG